MRGSFALLPCLSWAPEKMLITKFRFGLQCLIKGNYYTAISSLLLSFVVVVVVIETFSVCGQCNNNWDNVNAVILWLLCCGCLLVLTAFGKCIMCVKWNSIKTMHSITSGGSSSSGGGITVVQLDLVWFSIVLDFVLPYRGKYLKVQIFKKKLELALE